jgi:hypothetical protein
VKKVVTEAEKKHGHISAGTVVGVAAGVAAGVAGAIAVKDHHDEKTKKDSVRKNIILNTNDVYSLFLLLFFNRLLL